MGAATARGLPRRCMWGCWRNVSGREEPPFPVSQGTVHTSCRFWEDLALLSPLAAAECRDARTSPLAQALVYVATPGGPIHPVATRMNPNTSSPSHQYRGVERPDARLLMPRGLTLSDGPQLLLSSQRATRLADALPPTKDKRATGVLLKSRPTSATLSCRRCAASSSASCTRLSTTGLSRRADLRIL
jgi:hypothetical protein